MADQNQSPPSQAGVNLSAITFPLALAGTPVVVPLPARRLDVIGGAFAYGSQVVGAQFIAGLVGSTRTATGVNAVGIWRLQEQVAAKRLGQWP